MENYCEILKLKMDDYVHSVYSLTKNFPREELFGTVTQLRRAALSVILNYIEGFARRTGENCRTYKYFLNISYGSLKESQYLVDFSFKEKYLNSESYAKLSKLADEIGAMLYKLK
ncbi:MAG: four helix bundle protein [Patescibacteria group bacterium]|nr:four helix bundle protein [Patescibacteria group bacterium]